MNVIVKRKKIRKTIKFGNSNYFLKKETNNITLLVVSPE